MTNSILSEKITEMSDTLVSYAPNFESDEDREEYIYSVNEAILDLEKVQEQLEAGMHNKVNIEFLSKQVEKLLEDVEKLKDKIRANGSTQ